jgi:hypothetical protein
VSSTQEFSKPDYLSTGVLITMGGAQCSLNRTAWTFTSASGTARINLGLAPSAPTLPLNATVQAVFGARDTWPQRLRIELRWATLTTGALLPHQAHLEG